jgi:membrane protease YdiL (CAAX protease family)
MRVAVMLAFEGGLGVLAVFLGLVFGVSPLATARLDLSAILVGALATLPMFALFAGLWRSERESLRHIRDRIEHAVRELFAEASLVELACVSAAAGFGEEALFRGLVQGGLEDAVGRWPALALASIGFGLVHPVTRAYVVLVAALGVYLGTLWIVTGNLVIPMIAHGLYDFVALSAIRTHRNPG